MSDKRAREWLQAMLDCTDDDLVALDKATRNDDPVDIVSEAYDIMDLAKQLNVSDLLDATDEWHRFEEGQDEQEL